MNKIFTFVLVVLCLSVTSPTLHAQEIELDSGEYEYGSTSEFAESTQIANEVLADTGSNQTVFIAISVLAMAGGVVAVRKSYLVSFKKSR